MTGFRIRSVARPKSALCNEIDGGDKWQFLHLFFGTETESNTHICEKEAIFQLCRKNLFSESLSCSANASVQHSKTELYSG